MAQRDITGAVDFGHLESYAAGDAGLIEDVLAIFREQSALWRRLLEATGDAQGWRDAAHTIKGAALGIGAFRLAEVCDQAERSTGDEGQRSVLLDRVRDALDAALADIAAYSHELALQSLKTPRP